MNRIYRLIFILCAFCGIAQAQPERPKLVVGIVIDQMRWDYLYRYYARYGEGGFKRMLGEGFSVENCQIPYIPSVTAIGHSSVWTGSVPSIHGIAGNAFVKDGKIVNCVGDNTVKPVGSDGKAGYMSPRNLWVTTIGDELRLATNNRSKVVGVALKDRAALYKKHGYKIIRNTPFGCNLTFDIAKAAIEGENLGKNTDTDLLTISCSSTDYIGHQVGVNAVETEDCYLRLDQALADFFAYLDKTIGKGNYLTFLTADHGAVNNAAFLQDQRIPAGIWNGKSMVKELNQELKAKFNTDKDLVMTIMNYQVFFHTATIEEAGLDYAAVKQVVVNRLKKEKIVHYAFDMEKTSTESIPEQLKFRAINGYNRERSGGVQIVLKPAHYEYDVAKGTSHGAWNPYDIHIPLVFMGWHIQHGATTQPHYMTDIAATVSALLHIQAPNGCIGTPIF